MAPGRVPGEDRRRDQRPRDAHARIVRIDASAARAMVAAESRYLAEDAIETIVVEYEPLPALAGVDAALVPGAPVETPSPTALGGFRGMGEGGTIGAPAVIANAVSHALSGLGIEINELPITPERVFWLVRGRASP